MACYVDSFTLAYENGKFSFTIMEVEQQFQLVGNKMIWSLFCSDRANKNKV
jgi:hypothetical protein